MPPNATLNHPQTQTDELSLIKEGLDIYLQNHFSPVPCSERDKWPNNILREDFLGRDAQHKDYVLAQLSHGAYYDNWEGVLGVEKLNREQLYQLGIDPSSLNDEATGFQAIICRFNDLYILCYAGSNDIVDFYANIRQGLGFYEPQYFQAVGLTNTLSNAVKGNLICTGHSLGGGLASISALASQSPCVTFSPAGLAENTVNKIGMNYKIAKKLADEGLIRFYTVQYDWLDALQNSLPIPSALGNCTKMAYSEDSSWKNWLPHRLLTRNFIAHSMIKIIEMMCKLKPWNSWNAFTGDFNRKEDIPITEYPTAHDKQNYNWQECCKKAIRQGNINEFSTLMSMHHKQCDIDFLANQTVRATNGQFLQALVESPYGQSIKCTQLVRQKSILHVAAQSGRLMQSEILLKHGLAANIIDDLGNTPLHDALNSHALEVAELLLANGADWRIKNDKGYDCKDVLNNHILKQELLTQEGKAQREKIYLMMN